MSGSESVPQPRLDAATFSPLLHEWAVRRDVIDAILTDLDRKDVTLNQLAESALAVPDVPRTSAFVIRQSMLALMRKIGAPPFEKGGKEILAEVLRRQQAWLALHHNRPPATYLKRLPALVKESLYAKYPEKQTDEKA